LCAMACFGIQPDSLQWDTVFIDAILIDISQHAVLSATFIALAAMSVYDAYQVSQPSCIWAIPHHHFWTVHRFVSFEYPVSIRKYIQWCLSHGSQRP